MTDAPAHIGVLYSYGPHFLRTVRTLCERYPEAAITAFLPANFPIEMLPTPVQPIAVFPEGAQGRSFRDAAYLVRILRRHRLDLLVVLFDSPKLQLLGAVSGARQRQCHHLDGRITDSRVSLTGGLLTAIARLMRGHLQYARIWFHVHFFKVGIPARERSENGDGPRSREHDPGRH